MPSTASRGSRHTKRLSSLAAHVGVARAARLEASPIATDQRPHQPPNSELRLERAALELFLESGYDSVTVEQIAQAAGLSSRTFFRHFPSKSDLLTATARRRYAAVCDEMERRPRFESTFTALCESFVKGAHFDSQEAELGELQRKLLLTQPAVAERLRAGAEPMGDRLTTIVAQRLDLDPRSDMTADLLVRLVRSAARSAQGAWLTQAATRRRAHEEDLIALMRQAFALIAGARVLDVVAELERAQARQGLG
jgi:AcrR family transcriptional regulator